MTFIRRSSRSPLLFPHLHGVALDGAYVEDADGALTFGRPARPPLTESDMAVVSRAVAHRLGLHLRKHGFIDADNLETPSSPLMRLYAGLLGEPAGYIDVDDADAVEGSRFGARCRSTGEAQGFSVHAEVDVAVHDAAGRERLPPTSSASPPRRLWPRIRSGCYPSRAAQDGAQLATGRGRRATSPAIERAVSNGSSFSATA